jgi:hypothetical protein
MSERVILELAEHRIKTRGYRSEIFHVNPAGVQIFADIMQCMRSGTLTIRLPEYNTPDSSGERHIEPENVSFPWDNYTVTITPFIQEEGAAQITDYFVNVTDPSCLLSDTATL